MIGDGMSVWTKSKANKLRFGGAGMHRNQFEDKILHFVVALTDVYKEKEGDHLAPLELTKDDLTEDFTAMIYALWAFYKRITGSDLDILEFTYIVNRLAALQLMRDNGIEVN